VAETASAPAEEKLVTVEAQREFDLLTGDWEERVFVKLYVAARTSGLLREISDRDWKTLCVLATYMNAEGFCNPTQAQLAKALGVSRQMANERIQSLAKFRFQGKPVLLVERSQRKANGRWGRNGYRVLPISGLRIFDHDKPKEQPYGQSKKPSRKARQSKAKAATMSSRLDTVEPAVSSDTGTVGLDTNKIEKELTRQQDVVVILTNLGIHQDKAKQLAQAFPSEYVLEKVEFHNFLLEHNPGQIDRSPTGWLIRAIEQDYTPPHGFKTETEPAPAKIGKPRQTENEAYGLPHPQTEPTPDAPEQLIECWQVAHGELQLQMPREVFDARLRQARLLKGRETREGIILTVGAQNAQACEWLEHRLKKVVNRTLSQIAGTKVEVEFVVMSKEHFIRQRRQELGISQADLALRLKNRGVQLSCSTISRWERGQANPQLNEADLKALADVLKWSLDQLKTEMV
jgi:DNA-binding XRE family transcriptional regulator